MAKTNAYGSSQLVKQRYGTELRSRTLASLKPEISQTLDSLLDEIHTSADAKVLRTFKTQIDTKPKKLAYNVPKRSKPTCVLCKQAGRPMFQHYLSKCKYLPEKTDNVSQKFARPWNRMMTMSMPNTLTIVMMIKLL